MRCISKTLNYKQLINSTVTKIVVIASESLNKGVDNQTVTALFLFGTYLL